MLRIENKMIAPLFDRDWNAWIRRKILSCMWGNKWSCCPLETGRPRRAIQSGWKSWMKWQIFLPKKANSLCWSRYAGWRVRSLAGWTRAMYPPELCWTPQIDSGSSLLAILPCARDCTWAHLQYCLQSCVCAPHCSFARPKVISYCQPWTIGVLEMWKKREQGTEVPVCTCSVHEVCAVCSWQFVHS